MERRNKKKGSKLKDMYTKLPSELCTNHILPALPVKTLLQFRSVCKLWRDTIDQPCFVSNHFALSKNNVDKNQVIAIEKSSFLSQKRNCRVTVRHRDTMRKQAYLFQQPDIYDFQVSCNGLFLHELKLKRSYLYSNPNKLEMPMLRLWNPSIRKSLSIPPCPLVRDFKPRDNMRYLFGFRPSRNDYVVYAFRISDCKHKNVSVAVYTLTDNLWNIRNYKLNLPPDYKINYRFSRLMCGDEAVFQKGVLYWFGSDGYTSKTNLISFDFDVEKFSDIELPRNSRTFNSWFYRSLFILGGSVALFSISSKWSSIWVLKNESWDLLFSGTSNSVGFDYIKPSNVVNSGLWKILL